MENQKLQTQTLNWNDFEDEIALRKYLVENKIKAHKCQICEQKTKYNGKFLRLWVDRINRDTYDLSIDNLRLICPNCYSQEYLHNPFQEIRDNDNVSEKEEDTNNEYVENNKDENNNNEESRQEPEEKKVYKVTDCSYCRKRLKEVAILSRPRAVFCKKCESAGFDFDIETSYDFMKYQVDNKHKSYIGESKKKLIQEFPNKKSLNDLCSKLTNNQKFHDKKFQKDEEERFRQSKKKEMKELNLDKPKAEEIDANQEINERIKYQEEYRQEIKEKRELLKKQKEEFLEKNPGHKFCSDDKEAKQFTKEISQAKARKEWKKKQEPHFIEDDEDDEDDKDDEDDMNNKENSNNKINHHPEVSESLEIEIIENDSDDDSEEEEEYISLNEKDNSDFEDDEQDDFSHRRNSIQKDEVNGKIIEEEFEC